MIWGKDRKIVEGRWSGRGQIGKEKKLACQRNVDWKDTYKLLSHCP